MGGVMEIASRGDIEELIEQVLQSMKKQLNAHTKLGDVTFPEYNVFRHGAATTKNRLVVDLAVTIIPRSELDPDTDEVPLPAPPPDDNDWGDYGYGARA